MVAHWVFWIGLWAEVKVGGLIYDEVTTLTGNSCDVYLKIFLFLTIMISSLTYLVCRSYCSNFSISFTIRGIHWFSQQCRSSHSPEQKLFIFEADQQFCVHSTSLCCLGWTACRTYGWFIFSFLTDSSILFHINHESCHAEFYLPKSYLLLILFLYFWGFFFFYHILNFRRAGLIWIMFALPWQINPDDAMCEFV